MSRSYLPPGANRWPQYLPYRQPIPRSTYPVPNEQSINWPQSQFAPAYLPPGSPSFQPYSWDRQAVVLYGERSPNNTTSPRSTDFGGCGCSGGDYGCGCDASCGCGCAEFNPQQRRRKNKRLRALAMTAFGLAFAGLMVSATRR